MKVVCYFAAAEGSHPNCSTADYDKMWPVMEASVNRCGYDLIHLTSQDDVARCERTVRVDVDPATVMYSRELAWLQFLEQHAEGQQVVLVEPDCFLLRSIPPLREDCDMMLLLRPGKSLPCGFRLATQGAIPFYREVVRRYSTLPDDQKVFHGDVRVHHEILGLGPLGANNIPRAACGVRIEQRDWTDYTSKLWKKAVAWNFKGTSKHIMLDMAKGKMPEMR